MNVVDIPLEEAPQPRGRRAHRLATLLVLFLAVAGGTGGTWAAFTASTTNSSTFATGVLILSNSVGEQTACFSTAETEDSITTNDATCDELFELETMQPGDEDDVEVTVVNEGNLDGSLSAFAGQVCGTSDAAGPDYHGDDVNVCDDVQVYVQRYAGDTEQDADTRAGGACMFGDDDDVTVGECDGFHEDWTLDRFDDDFPDHTQAAGLGTLQPDDGAYFRVFIRLDPDATNAVQGLAATFGITWRLAQT